VSKGRTINSKENLSNTGNKTLVANRGWMRMQKPKKQEQEKTAQSGTGCPDGTKPRNGNQIEDDKIDNLETDENP
jgi:hypothetical protein